ncbi:MAG: GNAT family protein [Burkholderiaceae bacterium]
MTNPDKKTAINEHGQPIGFAVAEWQSPQSPSGETLVGQYCRLEKLDWATHGAALAKANQHDKAGKNWTYLAYGPFQSDAEYQQWVVSSSKSTDPFFYAIVSQESGQAVGVASFMRDTPAAGSIEVGHIHFSPLLQRTPLATEAMYLLASHVFGLGYRRYEWKCDSLNAPSRAAAKRLGFSYEGVFRQALVYKGRNRDTAWFAMIDSDWPVLAAAFERWLSPGNFDESGQQRERLSDLTSAALATTRVA